MIKNSNFKENYFMNIELKKIISSHVNLEIDEKEIINTSKLEDLNHAINPKIDLLINFEKLNNIRRINKFHNKANSILNLNGFYITVSETIEQRQSRKSYGAIWGFKNIFLFFDFLYKRAIPKIPLLKQIYFSITNGKNRVISKAEILGRLISCGFNIVEYWEFNNLLYVISKKTGNPSFDMKASYDPIFRMKRIGKNNKIIYVYKFRTMYPFSEYLQDFILKDHGYGENGKIKDDYRVTYWGHIFRKYWLDELPQLINVIKGEMSLVGVRPLSKVFLKEYPTDLLEIRKKYKPGCIPPYVALNMQSIDNSLESERIYLKQKKEKPILTDIKFFFMAIWNILTNKIKSA
tara:strand:- start:7732 stop:8778 length:1047 start_codon:yes stop_codon:yes gene_type:complete